MKVYKFGGASVRNAAALRNVASILSSHKEQLLVVVSAMGKATNSLEQIVASAHAKKSIASEINLLRNYHYEIVDLLFEKTNKIRAELEKLFEQIEVEATKKGDYDQVYDQVVSLGEVISSLILSHYLTSVGIDNEWIDARHFISTDNNFREAKVNWDKTEKQTLKLHTILREPLITPFKKKFFFNFWRS